MQAIYSYLVLSGVLTLLLWTPYIVARMVGWGIPMFLNNYPEQYPKVVPEQPLWAERAQRAHLNMVETMPAFIAVVLGSTYLVGDDTALVSGIASWSAVFFWSRLGHAIVYIAGIPYLRTPVYLLSWLSILMIASKAL